MAAPNFKVNVPLIPLRPNRTESRKKSSFEDVGPSTSRGPNVDTRKSSYYSLSDTSETKLKVLETYDEFLNLRDLEEPWNNINSEKSRSIIQGGFYLLKQVCKSLNLYPLDVTEPENDIQVMSLYETKKDDFDIKTAIVAQNIMKMENSKKKKTRFLKEHDFYGRSACSMRTTSKLSRSSKFGVLSKTKCTTSEKHTQINLGSEEQPSSVRTPPTVKNKIAQATLKTRSKLVQSTLLSYQDKFTNTEISYPNQEQCTQMYEHITENDLFCMEWIDKNLFRVPVNPNTVIVDQKIKDSSEVTCRSSNFFEQELTWERKALCI